MHVFMLLQVAPLPEGFIAHVTWIRALSAMYPLVDLQSALFTE
jgi:hypothetical protein